MNEYVSYGNGIVVPKRKIEKISEDFIQIIKKELPEEAQNITVIDDILSSVKNKIRAKTLRL